MTVFIAHELIHLLLIPGFFKSDKTYMGLTYLGLFVYTEEILSKKRHIAISALPFLSISILLPVLLGTTGLLNPLIIIVILLNSLGSSVDILGLIITLYQVPSDAQLTSNGVLTYWKKVSGNNFLLRTLSALTCARIYRSKLKMMNSAA